MARLLLPLIVVLSLSFSPFTTALLPRWAPNQPVDFTTLPQCVTDHVNLDNAAVDFGCPGAISQDCICSSSVPFPWASFCSPTGLYAIEQWFRATCPDVSAVSFDPLSNAMRDTLVLGSLERGCYSVGPSCFCDVSSEEALRDLIAGGEPGASKGRQWYAALCGGVVSTSGVQAPTIPAPSSVVPVPVASAVAAPPTPVPVTVIASASLPAAVVPVPVSVPSSPPPTVVSVPVLLPSSPPLPTTSVPVTISSSLPPPVVPVTVLVPSSPTPPPLPVPATSSASPSIPTVSPPAVVVVVPIPTSPSPTTAIPPASPTSTGIPPAVQTTPSTAPTVTTPTTPTTYIFPFTLISSTLSSSTPTAGGPNSPTSPASPALQEQPAVLPTSPCRPLSPVAVALDRQILLRGPQSGAAIFGMVFGIALGTFMLVVAGFEWLSPPC